MTRAGAASGTSPKSGERRSSPLARFLGRRLALYLVTVWGAVTLAFAAFRLMPGDPMAQFLGDLQRYSTEGQDGEAISAYYRAQFGLDDPLHVQYFRYLDNVVLGGLDLGPSFLAYPEPARNLILRSLPWTAGLFTTSILISWLLGMACGALLGWYRQSRVATLLTVVATLLRTVPVYFLALALIVFVGYEWRLLPISGPYSIDYEQPKWSLAFLGSLLAHAVLPMFSIVLVRAAGWAVSMRTMMVQVLGEDFLFYARAKGLSPGTVLRNYAFRNAFLPQYASLGIALGATLNGAFIIEILFGYPGIGSLFVRAMTVRDYNVMQGIVLMSILGILTLNLIVDLTMPLLDPRTRSRDA